VGKMTKSEVIAQLLANGNSTESAVLYADVFLEYQEATDNIEKNGIIVAHPRTGQPMKNPYADIRDSALRKIQSFRNMNPRGLWCGEEKPEITPTPTEDLDFETFAFPDAPLMKSKRKRPRV
jgi:hypothetical protein